MKALLAALLCLAPGVTMAQDLANIQLENYWFVFFVRGQNRAEQDEAARAKGLEGHLGNLTRLVNEGKAVAAGPFAGDQDRRGIVILKGENYESKEDVAKDFANDPFVKEDRLRVQAFKWMTPKGSIKKWREPQEMKSYVFVILDRGPETSPLTDKEGTDLQTAHLRHIFEMISTGGLGIAGPFADGGEMRGLLIYKNNDIENAKKLVAEDPLIKAGRLKATFLTLWMAAGIVGD